MDLALSQVKELIHRRWVTAGVIAFDCGDLQATVLVKFQKYVALIDRRFIFERNCVLRRWESKTLKQIINHKVGKVK